MGPAVSIADPERLLAASYAPAGARPALTALFALDERLGAIVSAAREPTIGLLRLAWWREALERLDRAPAPAEPLLSAVADQLIPKGVSGAALAALEQGWAALLDGEPDPEALARHGREHGGRLFEAAATLLAPSVPLPGVAAAGTGWGLADLADHHSNGSVRAEARRQAAVALAAAPTRWPGPLRPLGALTLMARRDLARDGPPDRGSPGRVARMLAMRLTGR